MTGLLKIDSVEPRETATLLNPLMVVSAPIVVDRERSGDVSQLTETRRWW